jgi:hypothetical protein
MFFERSVLSALRVGALPVSALLFLLERTERHPRRNYKTVIPSKARNPSFF